MESYSRRHAILAVVKELGEVSVEDLALRFGVSTNTIRTDLTALDRQGSLSRVRGGAVSFRDDGTTLQALVLRSRSHQKQKQAIGRWTAGLVQDGDAIILDASSSVFHLATFLRERRGLTVVAGGLEVALLLAKEPTNKVILAADTVRPNGHSLVGELNPHLLANFRASRCFVSCSSCSPAEGLTEVEGDVANLKAQLIKLGRQVVVLADHSKFETSGTFRFAGLNQIDHLVTDEAIPPQTLDALRRVGRFPVTVVHTDVPSADTVQPLKPATESRRYRIGFGNLSEAMSFGQLVRLSLEGAVNRLAHVELLVRDNRLDRRSALENADWFVANRVDLAIEFQADYEVGNIIMDKFNRAGIPVIAVDIPLPGATFFGADNYRAGFMAGQGLGQWIADHWQGRFDVLLDIKAPRVGPTGFARLQGEMEGLVSILGSIPPEKIMTVNGSVTTPDALSLVCGLLDRIPFSHRVAVITLNDDTALGALAAFERAGRLGQVVAVGQGLDRQGQLALRRPGFPFVGSTSYAPEQYGERVLDTALRILRGEPVPPAIYTRHIYVDKDTVGQYYPEPVEAGLR